MENNRTDKLNCQMTIPARNSIYRVKGDLERFNDLISIWEVYRSDGLDEHFYAIYKHIFNVLTKSVRVMDKAHKLYLNYGIDIRKQETNDSN